jgi:hypothetical protein
MNRIIDLFGMAVVGWAFVGVASADTPVSLDKVPTAVKKAVGTRFPGALMVKASKETEVGRELYELSIKDNGRRMDVTATPDGTLTGIERIIDAQELPKAVADALNEKYPKADLKKVEEVIKVAGGKETLEVYEVLLVTADNKRYEVSFLPNGTVKEVEDKNKPKKD